MAASIVESGRDIPFAHFYVLSAHYIALHKVNKANIVGRKYIKVCKFLQISIAMPLGISLRDSTIDVL
jgi:hypothetical protein